MSLLIVANTPSDNTLSLLSAVARGAQKTAYPIVVSKPLETEPEMVLNATGLIVGTTENFGYMSGQIKDFFERIYYPCLDHTQGRPWALYVVAGQDGTGAISSVERIVTGLKWRAIQPPLLLKGPHQSKFMDQCEELGMLFATGLQEAMF